MKRIVIKYWQELPLLVESLKRANSQLVYEWQGKFNPSRGYITSVNFHDVRITFEGEYWKVATRLYQAFCQEYDMDLTIQTFLWLAEHTSIIQSSLLGDDEFYQFIKSRNGYIEAEEFVKHNKLVNWNGEDFELYYNQRDMEMVQRLGMEIRPCQYQFRSKNGYYLPIDIHIRYNDRLMKWLRREGLDANRYEVTHNPELTIIGLEKRAIFDLARYLYQNEGLYELMIQWVDEPERTEYKITVDNTTVYIRDKWKECNEEHVKMSRELAVLSDYQLESFKELDILLNSHFDEEYGIGLTTELYNKLNIPKDRVLSGLTPVKYGIYEKEELTLGRPVPMSVDAEEIRIKTPYKVIKSGDFKGVLLPLVDEERYSSSIQEMMLYDTDIRVVLGKSSVPVKEKEFTLEDVMLTTTEEPVSVWQYPEVELDVETLPINFSDGVKVEPKRLMGTDDDFKYVPYVLDVKDTGESVYVTYVDGDSLHVDKDDKYKRSRVVFKDTVGVDVRKDVLGLTELLLSLGTDTLGEYEEGLITKEGETLIDAWLEALVSKEPNGVYQLIQEFSISEALTEEDEDDDFDIFEDIGLI